MTNANDVALNAHQDELCRPTASDELVAETLKTMIDDELYSFGVDVAADMAELDEYQDWQDIETNKPFDELNFREVIYEARASYRLRKALVKKLTDVYSEKAKKDAQAILDEQRV